MEPILVARDLTRSFGDRLAVDGLDLVVPGGAVTALLGRNGAGKSTALRLLLGFDTPTRGASTVFGRPSLALDPATRARIGYLAESHPVPGWMRPGDFAAWQAVGRPRWQDRVFTQVAAHFGLDRATPAARLSRGERAGLCLAAVLAADPDLLVLDDPALGLDPVARLRLLEAILYLTRREGRTVLFSSHHIADVERVADRVVVLAGGRRSADTTLDGFRGAIRRWRLAFGGMPPALPALPGLLQVRRDPDALEVVLASGPDGGRLRQLVGATACEELPLTLEEAFIAYVGEPSDITRFLAEEIRHEP